VLSFATIGYTTFADRREFLKASAAATAGAVHVRGDLVLTNVRVNGQARNERLSR